LVIARGASTTTLGSSWQSVVRYKKRANVKNVKFFLVDMDECIEYCDSNNLLGTVFYAHGCCSSSENLLTMARFGCIVGNPPTPPVGAPLISLYCLGRSIKFLRKDQSGAAKFFYGSGKRHAKEKKENVSSDGFLGSCQSHHVAL
jgi:hypothetical protein